ncbi:hypothetical protein AT01_3724 [Yersinia aldovae 670-83]|nr:hypothetical protein AT01_3724 [Yersinia aldovae 670-83]
MQLERPHGWHQKTFPIQTTFIVFIFLHTMFVLSRLPNLTIDKPIINIHTRNTSNIKRHFLHIEVLTSYISTVLLVIKLVKGMC